MSSILNHIEENPQDAQRLIGLRYPELQQLIQNAEQLHDEKQVLLESKKIRIITGGGGRKPKLPIPEQIILTLVYLRHLTLRVRQLPATGNPSSALDSLHFNFLVSNLM
jgi:hypothetical protein